MSELDFLFFGEAEEGFPKLGRLLRENGTNTIDFSLLGDIPGLIYRNDKGLVRKNKQSFEKNLDALVQHTGNILDNESILNNWLTKPKGKN